MKAVLVRNYSWEYVSGESEKPDAVAQDPETEQAVAVWIQSDCNKAMS